LEIEAKSFALDMGMNCVAVALGEGLNECELGDAGGLIHLFINILREIIKSIKLKATPEVKLNWKVEELNIISLWIYHRNPLSSPMKVSSE